MHNELVKLVESTNKELQENDQKYIEESVKILDEMGFGRGVVGRQMAARPSADEAKLFRLGRMLRKMYDDGKADSEEARMLKDEMKRLNDKISSVGKGEVGSGDFLLNTEQKKS